MMKKLLGYIILLGFGLFPMLNYARFEDVMQGSTSDISTKLERANISTKAGEGIKDLLIYIARKIIFPIGIAIGLLIAIIGFYQMMYETAVDKQVVGKNYLLYGVIGILICVSALWIAERLVGTYGNGGLLIGGSGIVGINVATMIYEQLMFPFLKLAMFFVVGILFVVLVVHFIRFIWASSEEIKNQSTRIITWNIIGILLILSAEQMVSAVYGKKEEVQAYTTRVSDVGAAVLGIKDFSFIYNIINWLLGSISFIILGMVVYQGFILVTRPEDAEVFKKLKKNLLYAFLGIMMMGSSYLLTNFVIVGT